MEPKSSKLGSRDVVNFVIPAEHIGDPLHEVFRIINGDDGVIVEVGRPDCLAHFVMEISGYRCAGLRESSRSKPQLRRKSGTKRDETLVVTFQPQHITEENHEKQPSCGAETWVRSRARLSGPTRLAFNIPARVDWTPYLRLDDLSDWSKLEPIVHKRARAVYSEQVEKQLEATFGALPPEEYKKLDIEKALKKIAETLVGPDPDQTALEMASRLILSPSEQGRWCVPTLTNGAARVPLWSARLDGAGRRSTRAIWSTWFKAGVIPLHGHKEGDTEDKEDDLRMLSLRYRDHWEIVGQTSVHGLPALRRLEPPKSEANVGADAARAPTHSVVRPAFPIEYLTQIDGVMGYTHEDTGIAVATAFRDADINLTSLGGIFRGEWKGDPARLMPQPKVPTDPPAPLSGFSLERLLYQSWLGRDIHVVAVEKGFLLPIGVRAALVHVHEREIYPDADGTPVSYLVRRKFIVAQTKDRAYPGPYHPHAARDFAPRAIRMLTAVTPDLTFEQDLGKTVFGLCAESLFWPQIPTNSGFTGAPIPADFQFQWSSDGAVVRSHLLFARNDVVGQPIVMRAVADYYNNLQIDDPYRIAHLGGARHGYAPSIKDGDTSFDTDNWVLGMRGREGDPHADTAFVMDSRMEGADQPPVYPFIQQAVIGIQSIDQLMGAPQGRVKVGYFDEYRDIGFGGAHDHQIFLKVAEPIALVTNENAERSGGVATPDLTVGGISRKIGLVGGKGSYTLAGDWNVDLGKAAQDDFEPQKFFGDAKLLGVVKLADLLRTVAGRSLSAAPVLIDSVEQGARSTLATVHDAARRLRLSLYDTSPSLDRRLADTIQSINDGLPAELSLKGLYPALVAALEPLQQRAPDARGLESALKDLEAAATLASAKSPIARIQAIGSTAIREIRALLTDPVPDAFAGLFDHFQLFFEYVRSSAEAQIRVLAQEAQAMAQAWLKDAFCKAIDRDGFGRILFDHAGSCDDLFAHPDKVLVRLSRSFYGRAFKPLTALFEAFRIETSHLAARIENDLEIALYKLDSALVHALDALADRLEPQDPTDFGDLRSQVMRAKLFDSIRTDIEDLIRPAVEDTVSFVAARSFAEKLILRIAIEADPAIVGRLEAMENALRPQSGESAKALLADIVKALEADIKTIIDQLNDAAVMMRNRLRDIIDTASQKGLALIAVQATRMLDAVVQAAPIAAIAHAGRQEADVCDAVGAALIAIGDTLIAATADIDRQLDTLIAEASAITVPPAPAGLLIARLQAAIIDAAGQAKTLTLAIERERQMISAAAAGSICANVRSYLEPTAAIMRLRRSSADVMLEIARRLEELASTLPPLPANPADWAALNAMISLSQDVYRDAMLIGQVGVGAGWQHVEDAVQTIAGTIADQSYIDRLRSAISETVTHATHLRGELQKVMTAGTLRRLAEQEIAAFEDLADRELAGLIAQAVGFTEQTIDEIGKAAVPAVRKLTCHLLPAYDLLEALFTLALSPTEEQTIEPYFIYAVGGLANYRELIAARAALLLERGKVEAIQSASDSDILAQVIALIDSYRNESSALSAAVAQLQSLFMADLGQNLTRALREQVRGLESEIQTLLNQFAPTSIQSAYDWHTKLDPFPQSDPIFAIEDSTDEDLTLKSVFRYDFATKERSYSVEGVIKPFLLQLVGQKFNMATIHFEKTRFTSRNGSAPTFDLAVKSVELGKYLGFMKTIQEWLSPKGSGFYIEPLSAGLGIEAGYRFDAGLIQVGTLQFFNVAFRVAARLSFTGGEAEYVLGVGDPDCPVVVANPPYGGAGWVVLTSTGDGVKTMSVAILFGGAAALKFGPLDAQGRVMAGISVETFKAEIEGQERTGYRFIAIFEAVGEGSIACFSIAVMIRIKLVQLSSGPLYGETTYKFSFKCGFIRISYTVNARYKLSGGSDTAFVALAGASSSPSVIYSTNLPDKETEWRRYRKCYNLELLKAAA